MQINVKDLSLIQLKELDFALEEYIFKELGNEPFAPVFRKDKQQFRKLIRELVSFKRDLMKLFTRMYERRWSLIKYHAIPHQVRFDEYDQYFYEDEWDQYNQELAQVIEEHRKNAYGLGLISLATLMGVALSLTPEDAQKQITNISLKMAKAINKTTQARIKKQIEASLQLGETREEFDQRLKSIFQNKFRGMLIAENEALDSWAQGRHDLAVENDMKYKTWISPQAIDGICGSVNNETVGINENFSNGLDDIPAHPRCRCAIEYSFDK